MAKRSVLIGTGLSVVVVLFWWLRLVRPGASWSFMTTDLRVFFYPTYHALFARAAHGELPLWNPFQLCGMPWLGSPQGGLFYPPHLLHLVLPTNIALAVLGLAHLLLIALSTAFFARRAGLGATAALLAALLFTLRGTTRSWFLAPPLLEAVAWLPLGCAAVLELTRRPGARAVALLAAVTASSWLAGGPQPTVYVLYAWTTLLPAALLAERAWGSRGLVIASLFVCAIGLGMLTAGAQLVPSMEMAAEGTRATRGLGLEALFPFGMRAQSPSMFVYEQTFGPGERFDVLGLALLPAALFARRHRALAGWAVVLGGSALLLSLGPFTPLFGAYFVLPALAWFRNPAQLMILVDFCFALAVAIAFDAVWSRSAADSTRVPLHGRLVVIVAAAVIGIARARWQPVAPALVSAAVMLLVALPLRRRDGAVALLALAVFELFLAPPNTALLPYAAKAAAEYHAGAGVYERLRALQGTGRVWILQDPVLVAERAPKLASYYQVRSVDDYESITLRRQAEYFTYLLEGRLTPAKRNLIFAGMLTSGVATSGLGRLGMQRGLLDLAGVRLVLGSVGFAARPAMRMLLLQSGLRPLPSPRSDLVLFENPHAVPRAYVVYRSELAPEPAMLLARLAAPAFDPLDTSYVEDPSFVVGSEVTRRGHAATIVRDEAEAVEVEATLEASGVLVLTDSFYPGWRATVDGHATTIVATNHLFRGVALTAGTHRVRFEYRPWSVAIGLGASVVGLLTIAGLLRRRHFAVVAPGSAAPCRP